MESTTKVEYFIEGLVPHPLKILQFSYRRKPEPYGVSALFGIYLAPTDESSRVCGTIRVNDFIQVTKDDPDFWNTK